MKPLLLFIIVLGIGCKSEEPPIEPAQWEHRPLLRADSSSYRWMLGRYDSTMYDIAADSITVHSGKWSAHVFSIPDSPTSGGYISRNVDPDLVKGKRIRLTAWFKADVPSGSKAYMYARMREIPQGEKTLGKKIYEEVEKFVGINDEMPDWIFFNEEESIETNTEWTKHEFTFDVPQKAVGFWFGGILEGRGKFWADDFSYKIIGSIPVDSTYKDISRFLVKDTDLGFE